MTKGKSSARGRQPWAGFRNHPVFATIKERLQSYGFLLDPQRTDEGRDVVFTRLAFDDLYYFLRPTWGDTSGDDVEFTCAVGLESVYVMEVENALRVWECGTGMLSPTLFPYREPMEVIRVGLTWLLLNADPPVKGRVMWQGRAETIDRDADVFVNDVANYALPFLQHIDSFDKTIHLLRNIDDFPRKIPTKGPNATEPAIFAALLLARKGLVQDALEELDVGMRVEVATIERQLADHPQWRSESIAARACNYKLVREYIQNEEGRNKRKGAETNSEVNN